MEHLPEGHTVGQAKERPTYSQRCVPMAESDARSSGRARERGSDLENEGAI